jgi:hypothetical protein
MRMITALRRSALVVVLVAAVAVPAEAQSDDLSFPPNGSPSWEGAVLVSGFISSDIQNDDGSYTVDETDIIGDTSISFDLTVDDKGQVTGGTMSVDLIWFDEAAGTSPVTLDPFDVKMAHSAKGNLTLSGDAGRLVASGSLEHQTDVDADGKRVEEVSGTETEDTEWIFSASEASCTRVAGTVKQASQGSIMNSVLVPREIHSEGHDIHNELAASFIAWPASVEDPAAIKHYLAEVQQAAEELAQRDLPEAAHLLALIRPWQDLGAAVARLDECQSELVGWAPEFKSSWLVTQLQNALTKALDQADTYQTTELIDLWDAGLEEYAIDNALIIKFLDAFHDKLNEAISADDTSTIWDILAWSSQYGYPNLHQQALQALEGGG